MEDNGRALHAGEGGERGKEEGVSALYLFISSFLKQMVPYVASGSVC